MAIIQFHKNRGVVTLNLNEVKHLNLIIPNKHGSEGKIVMKHNEISGVIEIEIQKGDLSIIRSGNRLFRVVDSDFDGEDIDICSKCGYDNVAEPCLCPGGPFFDK
jgi:hypothetical protein